jgi:hypothetical protein
MKRGALIITILAGLTLIYPLTVYYAIQAYQSWIDAGLERYPEELRPYVETNPFIGSFWGGLTIILGAFIACSWLLVGIWRKELALFCPV